MDTGLIHVYTGDGKGKTTAAIGQGVRAAGRGKKVYMVQFLKGSETGELKSLAKLYPDFQVFRFEKKRGFFWNLKPEEKAELRGEIAAAFDFARNAIEKKECDLIILDEIMGVIQNGLLTVEEVVKALKAKSDEIEVVLTGREAPREITDIAHYVSQICCVKHPYQQGVPARRGIEF